MQGRVDLHMHTRCSDGAYTPGELIPMVREKGIRVFSITDHDTLAAYETAPSLARRHGLTLIPGIELSVRHGARDVHVLAYGFDPDNARFRRFVAAVQEERERRNRRMVERLQALGCAISWEQVEALTAGASMGRPHIAQALVESGDVSSYREAFMRYLHDEGPAFVAREGWHPREVIDEVHAAGGVAVLAHPGRHTLEPDVRFWVEQGVDGIEVWHPSHDPALELYFQGLARRYGLLQTGGSDFHGNRASDAQALGRYHVSYAHLKRLQEKLAERRYATGH